MNAEAGAVAQRVRAGDVRAAGRLISDIENGRPGAREVLRELSASTGQAQLVGVTGPPGAGKSTLVACLIHALRAQGRSVGVVAVDPSSPFSGGAVLGDRDRMLEAASGDPDVFIRSLASRGAVGGLASAVNGAVDVMDAMGKDVVIVETVGVGQGEFDIARLVHTVVLVLVPGYGDSLQAMKAGITEIADVVAVNKGDLPDASQTAKDVRGQGLVRRDPSDQSEWRVPVVTVSSLRHEGVDELIKAVDEHLVRISSTGWRALSERTRRQAEFAALVTDRLRAELLTGDVPSAPDDPHAAADAFIDAVQSILRDSAERPSGSAETESP
ncbi:MAG TPA: methylmalonyl Co-A mutase-associated GTPase MeaB [Jatrophihabitantaceae bacterium]|nr:methylmalonyl Co-A mutase-associated GTPase MeaB [Jatrophihabitantaceae bacterium]